MPTTKAPGMLPGKANNVPVPKAFLIILAVKAAPAAHHGPSNTPDIALIAC